MSADRSGTPRVDWRAAYDRGCGAEARPALPRQRHHPDGAAGGRVAITDNAEPRMHVLPSTTPRPAGDLPGGGLRQRRERHRELARLGRRRRHRREQLRLRRARRARCSGGPPRRRHRARRPRRATVPGRLDQRRDRADLGAEGVAGANGLLYAYTKRPTWWGVARVVPHRRRRPHRPHRLQRPHRPRHPDEQPLRRRHPRPRRLGVHRHPRRHGARPGTQPNSG